MSKPAKLNNLTKMLGDSLDKPPHIDRFENADKVMAGRTTGILETSAPVVPSSFVGPIWEASVVSDTVRVVPPVTKDIAVTVTTTLRLPLSLVHNNPFNARQIYNPIRIQELAANIAMHGQLVPAPVAPHPELPGHYLLIDGHYRKLAIEAAGNSEIDCVVHAPVQDSFELYHLSYTINEQRSSQSALDNAIAWQHLLDEGVVKTGDALCQRFGFTPSQVSRTLSLLKLPEAAIAKIKDNPDSFKLKTAYELVLCGDTLSEEQLLNLMDRICEEGLSARKVEEIRTKLVGKAIRKPKESSCQYLRLHQGPARIGFLKTWDSGRIVLEVQVSDPKIKHTLFEELKTKFESIETMEEPT